VLSNLEEFKTLAPALETLEASQAMNDRLTAPLHPGAERAVRELLCGNSPAPARALRAMRPEIPAFDS